MQSGFQPRRGLSHTNTENFRVSARKYEKYSAVKRTVGLRFWS